MTRLCLKGLLVVLLVCLGEVPVLGNQIQLSEAARAEQIQTDLVNSLSLLTPAEEGTAATMQAQQRVQESCSDPISIGFLDFAKNISFLQNSTWAQQLTKFYGSRPQLSNLLLSSRDIIVSGVFGPKKGKTTTTNSSRAVVLREDSLGTQMLFVTDQSMLDTWECGSIIAFLSFISLGTLVFFIVKNIWFFTGRLPSEIRSEELSYVDLGLWTFLSTAMLAFVSSVCTERGGEKSSCAFEKRVGSLFVYPAFVLMIWGVMKSVKSTEEARRRAVERRNRDVGLEYSMESQQSHVAEPYAFNLNTFKSQVEEAQGEVVGEEAQGATEFESSAKKGSQPTPPTNNKQRHRGAMSFLFTSTSEIGKTLFLRSPLAWIGCFSFAMSLILTFSACHVAA